jgi:hypothetical protein
VWILCDAGDVCTIPVNIQKSFDQISRCVGHVSGTGALPASRVARRRRVRLVYLLGTEPVRLTLAEARALAAD